MYCDSSLSVSATVLELYIDHGNAQVLISSIKLLCLQKGCILKCTFLLYIYTCKFISKLHINCSTRCDYYYTLDVRPKRLLIVITSIMDKCIHCYYCSFV